MPVKKDAKEKVNTGKRTMGSPKDSGNVIDTPKTIGRPREHNREEIRIKMLEWVQANPDELNLLAFSEVVLIAPTVIIRWSKEDEMFRQTYDLVRAIIGIRRERALSNDTLHVKAYDLNAQTYDQYLKADRHEDMKYLSDLKSKENQVLPENDVKRFEVMMDLISKKQK